MTMRVRRSEIDAEVVPFSMPSSNVTLVVQRTDLLSPLLKIFGGHDSKSCMLHSQRLAGMLTVTNRSYSGGL